jgi:hypothetical protein
MTAKKSRDRNSSAAFGTILVTVFKEASRNLKIIFLFQKAA